jgi:hypothetical protein
MQAMDFSSEAKIDNKPFRIERAFHDGSWGSVWHYSEPKSPRISLSYTRGKLKSLPVKAISKTAITTCTVSLSLGEKIRSNQTKTKCM